MPVADTTLSGPAEAGAAPAAENPVAAPAQPAITFDPMLSFLEGGDLLMKQLTSEAPAPEPAPAETPEPSEAEVELVAEATEEPPAEEPETPAGIEAMRKRIDKITAQKHELREEAEATRKELEAARAELEKLRKLPPAPAPTLQQPLAHVQSLESLETEEQKAEAVRAWCLENWDGGTAPDGKEGEVYHTAETVRKMFAHFDGVLRKAIPQRRAYLDLRERSDAFAATEFPFLADPKSEGARLTEQFLANVPYYHPDARAVAAAWAEGELARRARAEKTKAKPTAPKPAPVPAPSRTIAPAPPLGSSGAPGLRAAPSARTATAEAQAFEDLLKNPNDPDSLARYFAASGSKAA